MVYTFFRLVHVLGVIVLGMGLGGVLILELWMRKLTHKASVVECLRIIMFLYRWVVTGGALVLAVSGVVLASYRGFEHLLVPWFLMMLVFSVVEGAEGNLLTRVYFRERLSRSEESMRPRGGVLALRPAFKKWERIALMAHYLDVPMYLLVVLLAYGRCESWLVAAIGVCIVWCLGIGIFAHAGLIEPPQKIPPHAERLTGSRAS